MNPFMISYGFYFTAIAIVILAHQGSELSTVFAIILGLVGVVATGIGFSEEY